VAERDFELFAVEENRTLRVLSYSAATVASESINSSLFDVGVA
jgi:hypothetical protein